MKIALISLHANFVIIGYSVLRVDILDVHGISWPSPTLNRSRQRRLKYIKTSFVGCTASCPLLA